MSASPTRSHLSRLLAVGVAVAAAAVVEPRAMALGEVQIPQIAAPQRGALAGEYSHVAFGPGELGRGSFTLRAPIAVPSERGEPLGDWLPSYGAGSGLGEWGMGWRASTAITRFRVLGDLDYASDELTGPWGRMSRGQDGLWYPHGLRSRVRMQQQGTALVAWLPDGSTWTFASTVETAQGTYAWQLTTIETPTGRKTRFAYDSNASGRLFLRSVSYGGVGEDFQYLVELKYETVPLLFVDYSSGQELTLDRRVQSVVVSAKDATSGSFAERWRYTLHYQNDPFGPAYYLVEIDQAFPSGQSAPPVRYGYRTAADHLATAELSHVAALDPLLQQFGADLFSPSRSALLDIDNDGRADLEEASAGTLLRQTDAGFVVEALPPAPPGARAGCRQVPSLFNTPRHLAELRAPDGETEVLDLESNGLSTDSYVCARDGSVLGHQTLDNDWSLGETTRLVDLDRDFQPDLIRVGFGFYEARPNESSGSTWAFGAAQSGTLTPAFTPTSIWVQDFNGDGVPDLIARDSSTVTVWFGEGRFKFATAGQTFDLRDASGTSVADLDDYTFVFVDANRDGLADLLLVAGNDFHLFVNNGYYFQQQAIPALASLPADASSPLFADLSGAGNDALTLTVAGQAWALALDEPGTGLLASADDGRGTVLSFDWQRAPATAGAFARQVVLSQLTTQSSGYDTVTASYSYAAAHAHTSGRFLVGYDRVTRNDATSSSTQSFLNDDDVATLALDATHADRLTADVVSFESTQYAEQLFEGLRWLRPSSLRRGFAKPDGSAVVDERTDYSTYQADFCPATTSHTDAHGTLTVQTTRAELPAFAHSLHCLASAEVQLGQHADARLDFRHEHRVALNAVGLPNTISAWGSTGAWVNQQITYNPDWTIAAISNPATGATTFAWDSTTRLVTRIVASDGTTTTVADRSSVTDELRQLVVGHGSLTKSEWFRYDGQGRLAKQWDSLGQGNEVTPDLALSYRYASANQPGSISATTLLDATIASTRSAIDLFTAGGEAVTSARLVPEGWVFDRVATRVRARSELNSLVRAGLPATADPTAVDYPTLLGGAQTVATSHSSSLGFAVDELTRFHSDVARTTRSAIALGNGVLASVETENGAYSTVRSLDAARRVVGYDDQSGTHHGYVYDALGRLRVVQLPDGTTERLDLDDYGRQLRVTREGIGAIAFEYDATTGLVRTARYSGADGAALRAVALTYDGAGRKRSEQHSDLVAGGTETFTWYYDGATPQNPSAYPTPGLVTAVAGDGYVKSFSYRADGKIAQRTTELVGWRTIESSFEYAEDGSPRGNTTVVRGADGALLSSTQTRSSFDRFGRVGSVALNGALLASLSYDSDGALDSAAFASGELASFSYDTLTRIPVGFVQASNGWTAQDAYRHDARGFIAGETVGLGNQCVSRAYHYSPQGFLAGAADGQTSDAYEYDASGLLTRMDEGTDAHTIQRNGTTLTAGANTYHFDGAGRTVSRNDLELAYGASGQLERAQRGSDLWSFKYDESGQRIVKLHNGVIVAGFPSEGYLDDAGLTQQLPIASTLVGIIRGGSFQLVPLDRMGTTIGDLDGTQTLASPYGNRQRHTALAAALDYVKLGWDADLGLIRMGQRDYDPWLGRFLTPDPLFAGSVQKCLDNPVACNLYGYANGDPVLFDDPSGLDPGLQTIKQGPESSVLDYFKAETWRYTPARDPDMAVIEDERKIAWPRRAEMALEKAKSTIERVVLAATAPVLLARSVVTAEVAELANPLPADGVFSRVMPSKYAAQFANGTGQFARGSEVFVAAAEDMKGFGTVRLAQQRLALFKDSAATIPNLEGDTMVTFRLREPAVAGIRSPIETTPPRGYGFVQGGRTGGGSREWLINNGTAADLGAFDIKLHPLAP